MSEKRFEKWNDYSCKVKDNQEDTLLNWEDVVKVLNKQQAIITELNKRKMKKNNNFGHYEIQVTDKSKRKKHYGVNGLEPIDAMKMGLFTYLEYIGFLKGNIIKYICRCDYKNGIEDLYKARDYIDYLIDAYKKKGDLND